MGKAPGSLQLCHQARGKSWFPYRQILGKDPLPEARCPCLGPGAGHRRYCCFQMDGQGLGKQTMTSTRQGQTGHRRAAPGHAPLLSAHGVNQLAPLAMEAQRLSHFSGVTVTAHLNCSPVLAPRATSLAATEKVDPISHPSSPQASQGLTCPPTPPC